MRNKTFFIFITIFIIIIIISLYYLFSIDKSLSPQSKNLEECHSLKYNGEGKINLVLFSSKENAEKYSDSILTTKPFSENKEFFNFYYIDSYIPECEIYKDIALLCYNSEIIKKASSCPNDYIIVIKDEPSEIRSSSYMNVMSLNQNHQLTVFPHEFGHAFAILAEEYTPANIPRGSKNCVSDCGKFETKDGCFQGCSKEDYYRSIENGIMRTLYSNTFGKLDEFLILEKIEKKIGTKITGSAIDQNNIDCTKENYYLIEASYSKDKIDLISKTLEIGCIGDNGAGFFEYNLILTDDSIIKTEEFNPELIFTDLQTPEQEQISGETYESDKSFLLKIPAIETAKTLEIIKDGERLIEVNLQNIGAEFCTIK